MCSQLHLAYREYDQAKELLCQAIELAPEDVSTRVFYSQALLSEGSDWTAAETALNNALKLDPDNQEALHNLKSLRHKLTSNNPPN